MGSHRLPGKVMLPLAGKPVLWHGIKQAKKLKTVDQVVLATTAKRRDDVLTRLAKAQGIAVFRGSEDDVLARFIGAAKKFDADVILRINADCPNFNVALADALVRAQHKNGAGAVFYKAGTAIGGFEVVTRATLERIAKKTKKPFFREHVTVYAGKFPRFAKTIFVPVPARYRHASAHIAIDTKEDYEYFRALYERRKKR